MHWAEGMFLVRLWLLKWLQHREVDGNKNVKLQSSGDGSAQDRGYDHAHWSSFCVWFTFDVD